MKISDPQDGGGPCLIAIISYLEQSATALRKRQLLGRQGLYQLSYSRKIVSILVPKMPFCEKSQRIRHSPFRTLPSLPCDLFRFRLLKSLPWRLLDTNSSNFGLAHNARVYPDVHVGLVPALFRATMLAQAASVVKAFRWRIWPLTRPGGVIQS